MPDPPGVSAKNQKEPPVAALRSRIREPRGFLPKIKEAAIESSLWLCSLISIIFIALIFFFLFKEGVWAFKERPLRDFIYNTSIEYSYDPVADETVAVGKHIAVKWEPVSENPKLSFLPLIWGSFYIAALASVISTLAGIGVGVYLAEMAREKWRQRIKPTLELMVGIPTVVIGFFMLAVIASPIKEFTDAIGIGQSIYRDRLNAFIGALGVSLVIIPVIASLVDDALRAVPQDLRDASYALGSTRWQTTWRVTLPAGVSGVLAAVILGFGRAFGETMIVLMCAGNAAQIEPNPFRAVRTMTASIAAEMGAAPVGSLHAHTLFLVGAVLVTFTFLLNLIVEIIANKYRKRIRH